MTWETIVGLEVHAELNTASKLFCACSTAFAGEPNSQCCPVCTGQPGSLPAVNAEAVNKAVLAGLALGCTVSPVSRFERKHYRYPDLPRAYQITQWTEPICRDGTLVLPSGLRVGIDNIHLEDDAGKLLHRGGAVYADYNRCGVALIEIVTRPDFRSADVAVELLEALRDILRQTDVSDCRMQEGSMRCDVNLSVRRSGEPMGTRTEIKNLNSFTAVRDAIEAESARQIALLASGSPVTRATRGFRASDGTTYTLRAKEAIADYRYFPDPDLPPLVLTEADVEALRARLPEQPEAKRARFVREYGLSQEDAAQLTRYGAIADYYERAAAVSGQSALTSSLILTRMFAAVPTEKERQLWRVPVSAETLGKLAGQMASGKIRPNVGKTLLGEMMAPGAGPEELLRRAGESAFDASSLSRLCREAIERNPKAAADFRGGKDKAIKALLGAVMAASKGQADPRAAEAELRAMLA